MPFQGFEYFLCLESSKREVKYKEDDNVWVHKTKYEKIEFNKSIYLWEMGNTTMEHFYKGDHGGGKKVTPSSFIVFYGQEQYY